MDGPLEGGRAGSRSPGYRQAAYGGGSSPPGATRHKWPFGCDTDGQLPEHQHVDVGDLICDRPNYAWYFRVQRVDPQRPLVYRSIRHPRRGSPIDITGPQSPQQAEQQLPDAGTYIDFAGALAPGPLAQNRTPGGLARLPVRTRGKLLAAPPGSLTLPLGLAGATYAVAMLRAIARPAEDPELPAT
jgi:hypothetical protein